MSKAARLLLRGADALSNSGMLAPHTSVCVCVCVRGRSSLPRYYRLNTAFIEPEEIHKRALREP
jgi:hypothetical protein